MQDDLARIAVGLPVASLWPLAVPYLARNRFRATAAAGVSAAYVLAPELPDLDSLALWALSVVTAFVLGSSTPQVESDPEGEGEPARPSSALAAKSFARFPTFREHQEGFAEYFLIGSLASISVAVAAAAATRAALGIGPF